MMKDLTRGFREFMRSKNLIKFLRNCWVIASPMYRGDTEIIDWR